ncbi:pyrroline-5-carboxylate reductase ProI [Microbacteriaceae bacterium 4G12]
MHVHKIAFVGAGSIAEAVIAGLVQTQFVQGHQITVSNRSNQERLTYMQNTYGVNGTHNKQELLQDANIIFFVMKPKDVVDAVTSIKQYVKEDQLIISLLAGVSTSSITNLLEKDTPIIRAMPNTSAAILKSATAISPSIHATKEHIDLAKQLFETIGIVSIVDEEQMHAVTALSGSGPAYIYYVVEAMEQAAREIGLDEATSKPLILQTMIGAAEMLKATPKHPSILRKEITSPGGTTQAGIETLQSYDFQKALVDCIVRATERSHELGETLTTLLDDK